MNQPGGAVAAKVVAVQASPWWMLSMALIFFLGLALGAGVAHAGSIVVNSAEDTTGDGGICTLRDAIAAANSDAVAGGCAAGSGADAITFAGDYIITLTSALPDLLDAVTIDGTGRSVAVSGANAYRVFNVSAGAVTLSSLNIISGTVSDGEYGGGLQVAAGAGVTVTRSTLRGNSAPSAGGVHNLGTLRVVTSSLSGNTAQYYGGGLYNEGVLTVIDSTVSGNSATYGGGLVNNSGSLTVANSTISGNSASYGGALRIYTDTVNSIINTTVSDNSATFGGGLYTDSSTTAVTNTIIAGNTGGDCGMGLSVNNHNLVQDETCGPALSGDPLLASLADNGGGTWTRALLPGSPAIDAGDAAACAAGPVSGLDQRGVPRLAGACDIGAFESRGFGLENLSGTPQSTLINTAFAQPLGLTVVSAEPGEPVGPGGVISFTAPDGGPSLNTVALTATTTAGGVVSRTVTANGTSGSYTVTAMAAGVASPAQFGLTNLESCEATETVTSAADAGAGSLRQALADVCPGGTVDFAPGMAGATIGLESQLTLDRNVTIVNGTGSSVTVSGQNAVRVFDVQSAAVTLSNLNIVSGTVTGPGANYGGAFRLGVAAAVTITHSTLRGNSAPAGGVAYTWGALTIIDSTLSDNSAIDYGGAVSNDGTLKIINSTVSGNSANYGGGLVNNSGLAGITGVLLVVNSTVSGNTAHEYGGGIRVYSDTVNNVINSTLSGNSAPTDHGAGLSSTGNGTVAMTNTIIANSVGGDCFAVLSANSNNLIEDGSCAPPLTGDPLLAPLADNGGATPTQALLPGSPAIDVGDTAVCAADPVNALDQRGVARPGGACDLGAFESRGFQFTDLTGTPQSAPLNTAFAQPLGLTVVSISSGEPVGPGGVISFTAPASGPSLDPAVLTTTTTAGGMVSRTVTANGVEGSYVVTATAAGVASPSHFQLTNGLMPVLSITKTATPTTDVAWSGEVTYTVALSNAGTGDAVGAVLSDTLPAEVTFTRWARQSGATRSGSQIDWSGTVTSGQAITLSFVATSQADYGATVTNTASYRHTPSSSQGHADASFTVIGAPVLALTKSVTPNSGVTWGGEVTYTLTLSNTGPADAIETVISDTLPAEVTFARWVRQSGATRSGSQIDWSGTVTSGQAITLSFVATSQADYSATVTNTASYRHTPSSSQGHADASFTVIGAPVLALSKAVDPATDAPLHGVVEYTLVLSNTGPANALSTLLTDTLPISATWAGWIEQPNDAVFTPGPPARITWIGIVTASETITLRYVMTNTASYGESVTNHAEAHHETSSQTQTADATYEVGEVERTYLPLVVQGWSPK